MRATNAKSPRGKLRAGFKNRAKTGAKNAKTRFRGLFTHVGHGIRKW